MADPRGFQPFSSLGEAALRRALSAGEERGLRAGRSLWCQGDRAQECCLVLEGSLRSVMYRSDETTLDLGLFGPGEWLGVAELLLSGPCSSDAVAAGPCRVFAFGRDGFDELLALPLMERWFLRDLARRQYALMSRVELSLPRDRILRHLEESARARARLEITQDELAEAVGTTRETVNRNLARLQAEGIVRLGRGWIEVLDRDRLSE